MAQEYNPRAWILFIVLLIYLSNPSSEPQQPVSTSYRTNEDVIDNEWRELHVLNSTTHGDFDPAQGKWLNMTGFRKEDGYHWSLWDEVRSRAYQQASYALGNRLELSLNDSLLPADRPTLYKNVTGSVVGEWKLSNLSLNLERKPLNLSAISPWIWYAYKQFDRNITYPSGEVRFDFFEPDSAIAAGNGSVKEIAAYFRQEDAAAFSSRWEMRMHGVHYPHSGQIILTTTSEKFSGIFSLPHFALTNHTFALAQELLNNTLRENIDEQSQASNFHLNPWSSLPEGSGDSAFLVPHCDYIIFLQQQPIIEPTITSTYLEFAENEMRHPSGAPLSRPPRLSMSMTAFSPDCGVVLESRGPPNDATPAKVHLRGYKKEAFLEGLRYAIEVLALIFAAQIFFLMRQMKETSTPSTRSRVSYHTIKMLAMGDSMISLTVLLTGIIRESIFYTSFAAFFIGLASCLYLSVRFILDIWSVQFTERMRQRRQEDNETASDRATRTETDQQTPSSDDNLLPLPVTARNTDTGATPIILPSDQDVDAEAATTTTTPSTESDVEAHRKVVYMQFIFVMFVVWLLSAFATTWPNILREIFFDILTFIYVSFWFPQIYRNILRNCRKAFRWDFVLSQSILRLIPISYLYAVEDNIASSKTNVPMLYMYIAWVWIQILALLSQEHLGARFFVPEGWAPPAYDYHPVLKEDEEDTKLPISSVDTSDGGDNIATTKKPGETRDKGKRVYDCTICAQDLEVPVVPIGGSQDTSAANILVRRTYMLTPCRHIFHTPCLEGWLRYRLQCPNCREILPPL